MKGQKKTPKIPGQLRQTLANNIQNLMDAKYHESRNRPKALAMASGLRISTVQRVLAAEVGATLDTVEALARGFKIAPYQLLIQDVALTNPRLLKLVSGGNTRPRLRSV